MRVSGSKVKGHIFCAEWTVICGCCCVKGVDCGQQAARVWIEEACPRVMYLDTINILHAVKLPIEQLFLVVSVLQLSKNCHVYQVKLLLDIDVTFLMVVSCGHALFNVPSESFEVNIKISFQWCKFLMDQSFNHSFLKCV